MNKIKYILIITTLSLCSCSAHGGQQLGAGLGAGLQALGQYYELRAQQGYEKSRAIQTHIYNRQGYRPLIQQQQRKSIQCDTFYGINGRYANTRCY